MNRNNARFAFVASLLLGMITLHLLTITYADAPAEIAPDVAAGLEWDGTDLDLKTAQAIVAARNRIIEQAIKIVEAPDPSHERAKAADPNDPSHDPNSPKAIAMALLGDLRAEQAVPVLVKDIAYRASTGLGGVENYFTDRKAMRALQRIGLPAIPGIIAAVADGSMNEVQMKWAAYTLCEILGKQEADRVLTIQIDARGDALNAKARQRLVECRTIVRDSPFGKTEYWNHYAYTTGVWKR